MICDEPHDRLTYLTIVARCDGLVRVEDTIHAFVRAANSDWGACDRGEPEISAQHVDAGLALLVPIIC
jgi:hypothetical protein